MAANTRKGTPGKTLVGFASILGIVAVLNVRDCRLRPAGEEWFYPSALGDGDLLEGYAAIEPGAVVATFQGRSLVVPERRLVALEDAVLEKAGRDDEDRFFLYRAPGGDEEEAGKGLFIKVEPGAGAESNYLRVHRE